MRDWEEVQRRSLGQRQTVTCESSDGEGEERERATEAESSASAVRWLDSSEVSGYGREGCRGRDWRTAS